MLICGQVLQVLSRERKGPARYIFADTQLLGRLRHVHVYSLIVFGVENCGAHAHIRRTFANQLKNFLKSFCGDRRPPINSVIIKHNSHVETARKRGRCEYVCARYTETALLKPVC